MIATITLRLASCVPLRARNTSFQKVNLLTRWFSVKELAWCSNQRNGKNVYGTDILNENNISNDCRPCINKTKDDSFRFGIIAAMDESRIIGIDRDLPWHLPEDRQYFEDVTKDKALILGRNSFFETNDHSHLDHLGQIIVVSSSMEKKDFMDDKIVIVRSFEEALECGKTFTTTRKNNLRRADNKIEDEIDCWIGGGQLIYEKAVRHPSAWEIRLTEVHSKCHVDHETMNVSYFPAKYRWDNIFKEVHDMRRNSIDSKNGLSYTFFVYRRR